MRAIIDHANRNDWPTMNRYPIWKYIVILVALAIGITYTLPNFFGEAPAVQVSSAKATVKVLVVVAHRECESDISRTWSTPNWIGQCAGQSSDIG